MKIMKGMNVVFPGSFDPPTNGHVNLIKRASRLFRNVIVVLSINPSKKSLFSNEERLAFLQELTKDMTNVKVMVWEGLIVDFVESHDVQAILRGVRALADFSYEFELSVLNKQLAPSVETIFMPTDQKYFVLRSSSIKEIAQFNGDISRMVPPVVEKALFRKIQEGRE